MNFWSVLLDLINLCRYPYDNTVQATLKQNKQTLITLIMTDHMLDVVKLHTIYLFIRLYLSALLCIFIKT